MFPLITFCWDQCFLFHTYCVLNYGLDIFRVSYSTLRQGGSGAATAQTLTPQSNRVRMLVLF